jgi:hypothetical protein
MYKSINYGSIYVDISNIKLYGLQSMNYYINSVATVLTYVNKYNIYGYPLDKIYDGTTVLLLSISGLLPNDTIIYMANYTTKNVGTNNLLPAITDGPYNIIYRNSTANILPLLLKTTITSNKVYDGLPNITLNFTLSGILTIDDPVLFTYLQPNYSVSTIGNYGIYPWSTDSNFIDANYYYGFIAFGEKNYKEALSCFKIAETEATYAKVVPFYIAEIYYFNNEREKAKFSSHEYPKNMA